MEIMALVHIYMLGFMMMLMLMDGILILKKMILMIVQSCLVLNLCGEVKLN